MIKEFQGEYRWLSNFWPAVIDIDFDEHIYPSVEHAYQAAKAPREERKQFLSVTAAESKKLGKKYPPHTDSWSFMYELLKDKFSDKNPELKQKLLDTGTEELQEGNMWWDTYWGVDLRTGKGENQLGKLLMTVRTELNQKR